MITNKILEEKWKVQAEIALEANYDINKFAEIAHNIVQKMYQSGKLKYSKKRPVCIVHNFCFYN